MEPIPVLTGKAAENFFRDINKKSSKEKIKFLEECVEVYNKYNGRLDETLVLSKEQFNMVQKALCLMYNNDDTFCEQIMNAKSLEIERGD